MPAEITLLPKNFKVLVDAPYDGIAEEWCWVPVAFAPTEGDAMQIVRDEAVSDGAQLEVHGREWWRRDPAFTPTDNGTWRNESEDTTVEYEPWEPCSKFAETGVEVWRIEVDYEPPSAPATEEDRDGRS